MQRRIIRRAEKFAAQNRKETIDALQKYVKLDRDLLERGYYQPHLDQQSDPNVCGVQTFWTIMQNSGFVESNADITMHLPLSPSDNTNTLPNPYQRFPSPDGQTTPFVVD